MFFFLVIGACSQVPSLTEEPIRSTIPGPISDTVEGLLSSKSGDKKTHCLTHEVPTRCSEEELNS